MKARKAILLLLILVFVSCNKETGQVEQVKRTVMRYNQLLIEGYKTLNMNPLQEVATIEQAEKLYYHMAAFGEAGIKMQSQLKKINFESVKFQGSDKAEAKTTETWDYAHFDIKNNEKIYEEKDFVYYMTYELKRDGNRWIIEKVTASGEEKSASGKKHPRLDLPPTHRK